jgi:nitrogen-specific signal transduction histidine kinase
MYLVCYLAHSDHLITAVQERLALASPPKALVTARSVPELINQSQTLPAQALVVDITWPRATWGQLVGMLAQLPRRLPLLALSEGPSDLDWWGMADDLLRLDDPLELFLHRLERDGSGRSDGLEPLAPAPPALSEAYSVVHKTPSLLEHPQFRQFAEILSGLEESTLMEAFVGWVQQACQTSRAVLLVRDADSGAFTCQAQRGLSSTLVPYCTFPQTAPLCRWLATTGRILLKESGGPAGDEALAGLELMQAVAAVPVVRDGQLVGILGIGPRLVGHSYSATELEALYALGGQIAAALHHCRRHNSLQFQQDMTAHMLGVMPTGTLVLGEDQRIALVNAAAADLLGKSRSTLQGADLRILPSPLGDLAYQTLTTQADLPRREIALLPQGRPIAVSGHALATMPPSAMLVLEDLTAHKRLEEERERRVNLEVVTNLIHYLAHELRNPLVTLSTFAALAPTRANDPEFQQMSSSLLQSETARVNLILEQLLVLTHDVEFQCQPMELPSVLARVIQPDDLQQVVTLIIPAELPRLHADPHRLETAFACILRTMLRLADPGAKALVRLTVEDGALIAHAECPTHLPQTPEWLLTPWQQLLANASEQVDLGLATAQYIVEHHQGTFSVAVTSGALSIVCRFPVLAETPQQEIPSHAQPSTHRR